MIVLDQLQKYVAFLLMVVLVGLVGFGYLRYKSYMNQMADLRNQIASRDHTSEEMQGSYTKIASENTDLKASNTELQQLLDKTKQDLVAEHEVVVYWKGQYTYIVNHQPVPNDHGGFTPPLIQTKCTATPQLYHAEQDIGLLSLGIDTYTLDPSYQQKFTVSPGSKPLQLTLDLTRDRKRQWHTHVQSSDERVRVEIGVSSVNVEPLDENWYEKLKIHSDIGVSMNGGGVLAGVGVGMEFREYEIGPSVWGVTGGGGSTFGGINFTWTPFKKRQ